MANRWNIPDALEHEIIQRDQQCVYCGVAFVPEPESRASKPTWEHIVNDARIVNRFNIARCCAACNASKGRRSLLFGCNLLTAEDVESEDTVADVVKRALEALSRSQS